MRLAVLAGQSVVTGTLRRPTDCNTCRSRVRHARGNIPARSLLTAPSRALPSEPTGAQRTRAPFRLCLRSSSRQRCRADDLRAGGV